MPKFSVVIPTYNCARFIGQAVDSVLSQSCSDLEMLVVDDGSTDETENMMAAYASRPEVTYLRQENAGPGAARNNGIRNAVGDYIVFLDSDDLLYENCLECLADFIGRNHGVDFLFTNYDIFDESRVISSSGVDTWKVFRTLPHREVGEGEWIFTESLAKYIIRHGGFMHTSGTTIRRALFEKVGGFKEGYCYGEDDDLYARATYTSVCGYIDRVLSGKRNHTASLIHNPTKKLRNTRHYLELTEGQLEYYRADKEICAIVSRKLEGLAYDFCWCLQMGGALNEAHDAIFRYLHRGFSWSLFKLLVKNYIMKANMVRSNAK